MPGRLPRRGVAVVAVLAAAGVVAAAAWVTLAPTSTIEHQVTCYSKASLDSTESTGQNFPNDPADKAGEIALDECRLLWSAGAIGSPAPVTPGSTKYAVPRLQLCIAPRETYAVFPDFSAGPNSGAPSAVAAENRRFCGRLGLGPAPAV